MKTTRWVIILTIIIIVIGFNKYLFSWGLFNLFSDVEYSQEGLDRVMEFDPDNDILFLPPVKGKGMFEAINDLSITRKKEVRKYIYIYLTSGREYVKRSIEKSYLYMDIIDEIFEENSDMPKELALLPLLESGFNPYAVSKSHAVGLWQFMSNTSAPLGLRNNRWVDERRDIEKSTEAAITHLRNLHKRFGSWGLALAAYNGGGGHVSRAVARTSANDIWELKKTGLLRQETYEYVPRYIALVLIYKNQRLYGIKDEISIPEQEKTVNVVFKQPVNIKDVSTLTGVPIKTLKELNPELVHNMTPPSNRKYTLRVPEKAKESVDENISRLYRNKITRIVPYRVQPGDSVSAIARKYKKKPVHYYSSTV